MRFSLTVIVLTAILATVSFGGKVVWTKDGKPIIEKSKKPIKGCQQKSLPELARDNNNTTKCSG